MFSIRSMQSPTDESFQSAEAVLERLRAMPNNHVSVFRESTNGLKRVFYVSIDEKGNVHETYNSRLLIVPEYLLN